VPDRRMPWNDFLFNAPLRLRYNKNLRAVLSAA